MTDTLEEIARIFSNWKNPSHIRLQAGEMSAQEMRSVLAVVGALERAILSLPAVSEREKVLEEALGRADLLLSKIETQKHHPNYELYLEGECVSIASLGTSFADLFWSFHKRVMTVREEIRALRSTPVQTGEEREIAIASALSEAHAAGREEAENCIPTNWCDPLLSGDGSIKVPAGCPEIEKLLLKIRERIRTLPVGEPK